MYALTIETLDNMNSKHLELYTILGEYDNTGFPLSYCLLTTASSLEDQKCTRVLESWGTILRDTYGLVSRFVHMDKDMAEIGTSQHVWPEAKHQLCWWHQHEALWRQLKGNLPTSRYNVQQAQHEHPFISLAFKPHGCTDPNDCEGGVPGEIDEHTVQKNNMKMVPQTSEDPNSIKIQIPALSQMMLGQTTQKTDDAGERTPTITHSTLPTIHIPWNNVVQAPEQRVPPDKSKFVIQIPAPSTIHETDPVAEDEPDDDDETTPERHTFCPIEHCTTVVKIMECHLCAHPLILGYSVPTPEGIKTWAVKQMYEFCVQHELPNLWAYLWENWYRHGRWELWAQSGEPREILCLKTTMFVEGQ